MLMHLVMGLISPVYVSGSYWADPVRYKPNFWPVFYFWFFFYNDKIMIFFFERVFTCDYEHDFKNQIR